jgi:hypothetical protein
MFDWLKKKKPFDYYLVKVNIKQIRTNEQKPHVFFEELYLIKARDIEEAYSILKWKVENRKTSWCVYLIENSSFEKALSND